MSRTKLLAQSVHCACDVAPADGEYVPLTQLSQAGAPGVAEYVPAKQSVHVKAPAFEDLPAAQAVQLLVEEAPAVVEYLPARQEVQLGAPVTILYFPCAHAMQLPPFGPV